MVLMGIVIMTLAGVCAGIILAALYYGKAVAAQEQLLCRFVRSGGDMLRIMRQYYNGSQVEPYYNVAVCEAFRQTYVNARQEVCGEDNCVACDINLPDSDKSFCYFCAKKQAGADGGTAKYVECAPDKGGLR
jgi:hypothetical protein